jgi:hypothetical protein
MGEAVRRTTYKATGITSLGRLFDAGREAG